VIQCTRAATYDRHVPAAETPGPTGELLAQISDDGGVEFARPDRPLIRADDRAVVRGDAVFETLRAAGGRLDNESAHLDRLEGSAAAMGLPVPDRAAWTELARQVTAAWGARSEGMLRLVYSRGVEDSGRPTCLAMMSSVPESTLRHRRDGVRVVTLARGLAAADHADAPWLLVGAKTTSYAVNMAAQRHARAIGADDAIFLATDGQVLEAPTATVVWAVGKTLCTPPVEAGILDGTAVRALFRRAPEHGLSTDIRRAWVADLHAADGVWLTSSVRGAVVVTAIDGQVRGDAGLTPRVQSAAGL